MQLQSSLLSLLAISTLTTAIRVSYDEGYDIGSRSLAQVACSDGSNGLLTKGFTTQASLPTFPRIGGASTIAGWNSPSCGTCYTLTFQGRSITVLAVDHAGAGFNIGKIALNDLTNGRAVELGSVDADWKQVDVKQCGL